MDAPEPAPSSARPAFNVRVLIVDQSGELGGAELALLPVATAMRATSEVVLLSDGPFRYRLADAGVAVTVSADARVSAITKDRVRFAAFGALAGIARQVRRLAAHAKHFDLLYLNTQKALVLGALAKPLCRKPVVWHLHDIVSRDHFGRVQLAIVRFVVRRWVDFVIANSQAAADSLAALAGTPANRMVIAHNGIDPAPFEAVDDSDRLALRHRFGLPVHVPMAGIFGRLAHWKGQHVVLEAAAAVPGLHVAVVGSAMFGQQAYEASIRQQAHALGIAERVHFLGFQDDIPALMKAVDVVIHASVAPEPFGRVVVEGMLSRRPVIATAAGGVIEIVEHGVTGLLVPPGDAAALAAALRTLQRSPALAQSLAARAFDVAVTRFSETGYVAAVIHGVEQAAALFCGHPPR